MSVSKMAISVQNSVLPILQLVWPQQNYFSTDKSDPILVKCNLIYKVNIESRQLAQKRQHDVHCKEQVFQIGDPVFVRNFGSGPTWLLDTVKEVQGSLSYTVRLPDGI